MKKNILKFNSLLTLFIIGLSLTSCKNEEPIFLSQEASNTKFIENIYVQVPSKTKKRNLVKGTISGVFNRTEEKVKEFKISDNILKSLNLSNDQFSEILQIELNKAKEKSNNGEHSECIEGCNEKYTDDNGNKIKGRGACKFGCWVDTVVTIIKSIGDDIIKGVL